ncbi:MAG: creatininase family protein [Thermomicrobiales bacterium]
MTAREGEPQPRLLLHEITRTEAARRAPEAVAILPVGATEQHGPHLPLGTDFLAVEHIARCAAALAQGNCDVLVTPTLPFGSSHHHYPFGGTISLATEHYYAAVRDMVESLVIAGFQRVFILNGHGGNHELVQLVARDLILRHAVNLAAASYWDLARTTLLERDPDLGRHLPGHAGLFETSLIMAIRPDLVSPSLPQRSEAEQATATVAPVSFRAERAGWWQSLDGFTDGPALASANRGTRLLQGIIPAVGDAFVAFARMPLFREG